MVEAMMQISLSVYERVKNVYCVALEDVPWLRRLETLF